MKKYDSTLETREAFLAGQAFVYCLQLNGAQKYLASLDSVVSNKDIEDGIISNLQALVAKKGCVLSLYEFSSGKYQAYLYLNGKESILESMLMLFKYYRAGKISKKEFIRKQGTLFGYSYKSINCFLRKVVN